MARLGEILLSEKVLTARDLDTALKSQTFYGIKLGTCLVEMGFVTDDDLARCLGRQTGLAFLTKDQPMAIGTRNLSVIPTAAIKKHRLIPVGNNGAAIRIATDQTLSPKKRMELERFVGRRIEQVTVSGYAIDFFLEQMFGTPRPGRFLPGHSGTKHRGAAPVVGNGIEWKRPGGAPRAGEAVAADVAPFSATTGRDHGPPSLSVAAERLNRAASWDDVARTALNFLSYSSGTVALMIVKDGLVRGWKACSNRRKLRGFEAFSSPIESLPELQQCVITGKPYLGDAPAPETKRLLQKLHSTGENSAFFPIFIRQRVIAVLLCDASERLNPSETAALCRKASYALEILSLRSKLLR